MTPASEKGVRQLQADGRPTLAQNGGFEPVFRYLDRNAPAQKSGPSHLHRDGPARCRPLRGVR